MNPDLCPLCGKPNRCAMEVEKQTGVKQPPCWCTKVDFSDDLVNAVPLAARGLACICAACQESARSRASAKPGAS
ncbi:MAG TPA: cysteine-rich CWC family protein [Ramlibacter sp.]|uniref:cysteine-rich CWC family protein n=1 Tax=Ramlibacter sp. TaxID=1917967 RepID=UPI002BE12A8A|nr:cysteine-rich CWC family protein [Ramlibacter sp.]HVZ42236.1 cysteine-rich CWC family protein [Ramlibacter sp.]